MLTEKNLTETNEVSTTPQPYAYIATEIKNPKTYAPYEISGPRYVNNFPGKAWLICLKGVFGDKPYYFGVFIQNNRIVNIRGNIVIDLCPKQLYEPFPLDTVEAPR